MKKIPFSKFTSYGNNFVLVDEVNSPIFGETEKGRFAHFATNMYFGIGSDNFLVVQRCTRKVLDSINQVRGYWDELPDLHEADFIFRMFEPDGTEAFSCGNGLMCIANYLFRTYQLASVKIVTEIPTNHPKIIDIGTERDGQSSWANLGQPRKITQDLFKPEIAQLYDDIILTVDNLEIGFRAHDLEPFSNQTRLSLKGYIVFTGEPHMVIYPEKDGILSGFEEVLFATSEYASTLGKPAERRVDFGIWLVDRIGLALNNTYKNMFPAGMSINFARPVSAPGEKGILEYRCFERGIFKETLACGTGAVAVSYISKRLNKIIPGENTILPYRCRLHEPESKIKIHENETGECRIIGFPVMLVNGEFELNHL